jgi:hypothetical protein
MKKTYFGIFKVFIAVGRQPIWENEN